MIKLYDLKSERRLRGVRVLTIKSNYTYESHFVKRNRCLVSKQKLVPAYYFLPQAGGLSHVSEETEKKP